MPLQSINHEFIKNFEHYLKTIRNCGHNTTVKYIRNLRKIIRIALSNDCIKLDPFRNIKYSLKEVNRAYLTDSELKLLINKDFSIERLSRIKDIFIFCCFTGLAFSDVKSLTRENITIGINNQIWLRTKRKKTGNPSEIPLLQVPIAIMKKYENDPICDMEQKLLPVGSNQKMNAYLKEIADLCNIKKNLSPHTTRHTFATTVTLTHGVSMEAVSKMLGHSNLSTTKQYARIVDTLIIDEMKKVQELYHIPGTSVSQQN
jgi:integrase